VEYRYKALFETQKYRVFQKELYNGIPNITMCGMLQKRLHFKTYKLSLIQGVEHLEYYFEALFETP
jgi:hypothetical protein